MWENSRPVYCRGDHAACEKLLGRHMRHSSTELFIFEKLCAFWREEIYYYAFSSYISNYGHEIESALPVFLRKLENAGLAVVRTIRDEGGLHTPDKIILADQHAPRLIQAMIEEHYSRMRSNPSRAYLIESQISMPHHLKSAHIKPISLTDVHDIYAGHLLSEPKIYLLSVYGESIVLCFSAFNDFYAATEEKVKGYIQAANLFANFQRAHGGKADRQSLLAAVKKMDYAALRGVLKYMMQNYHHLIALHTPREHHLLQAIGILHHVSEIHSERDTQLRVKDRRAAADIQRLHAAVHDAPQQALRREEYAHMITQHQGVGAEDQQNIVTLYTNAPTNPILITEHTVIHKEHLHAYIANQYAEVRAKVHAALVADVHTRIVSRDLLVNVRYSNISTIEDRIVALLRSIDSVWYHLLNYSLDYASVTKELPYPIMAMFAINLVDMFADACKKQSWWRQLLYMLSNEYADLRSHFSFLDGLIVTDRHLSVEQAIHMLSPKKELISA